MRKRVLLPWLNLVALIVTIAVNGLANALPLNGLTTGDISDRYPVYFVPAGYVFGIWGLIYALLTVYVVYQLLPSGRQQGDLGGWFAVSCLANVVWLVLWHYLLISWTVVAMLVLLATLIAIYLRLYSAGYRVTRGARWLVRLPFSIYLGWVTVATIANLTDALYAWGWGGWGIAPPSWAVVMLVVSMAAAAAMAWRHRDLAYGLVIVWAQVGIAVKHSVSLALGEGAWVAALATTALVLLAVLRSEPDTASAAG